MPIAEAVMLDHWSEVLQLMLPGDDIALLRRVIDECFAPSDAIIATEPFRLPDVFVSDMDSTMIGQECIDELADYAGLKPQIAAIRNPPMKMKGMAAIIRPVVLPARFVVCRKP